MSMEMMMGPRLEQHQTQEQKEVQRMEMRMHLAQILRGEQINPEAICPQCNHRLTPEEILAGFTRDPNDFTTQCPQTDCKRRFEAQLVWARGAGTRAEVTFLCPSQALEQLKGRDQLSPETIMQNHGQVYRSALVHFGSLKAAFKENGVDYLFDEIDGWKSKIEPFLGSMPDTIIAECCGVSVDRIRRLRTKLCIRPFNFRS